MVSLLNDARLKSGKPTMGFINPWLYHLYEQDPNYFNDVTMGDNRCTAQRLNHNFLDYICCKNGFQATPGFDAVSGLGSPRFEKLYQAALNQRFAVMENNDRAYLWYLIPVLLLTFFCASLFIVIAIIYYIKQQKYMNATYHVRLNDMHYRDDETMIYVTN